MRTIDIFRAIACVVGLDADLCDIKKRTNIYPKFGYATYAYKGETIRVAIPTTDATPPAMPRPANAPQTEQEVGSALEAIGMKFRVYRDMNADYRAYAKWQGTDVAMTALRPNGNMTARAFRDLIARNLYAEYVKRYGYE